MKLYYLGKLLASSVMHFPKNTPRAPKIISTLIREWSNSLRGNAITISTRPKHQRSIVVFITLLCKNTKTPLLSLKPAAFVHYFGASNGATNHLVNRLDIRSV